MLQPRLTATVASDVALGVVDSPMLMVSYTETYSTHMWQFRSAEGQLLLSYAGMNYEDSVHTFSVTVCCASCD